MKDFLISEIDIKEQVFEEIKKRYKEQYLYNESGYIYRIVNHYTSVECLLNALVKYHNYTLVELITFALDNKNINEVIDNLIDNLTFTNTGGFEIVEVNNEYYEVVV